MCNTTRDLSLQMYALRWNLFFACRFATPHFLVISWDLPPTFSPLQKLGRVRVAHWFSFYVLCFLFCLSSSCVLCTQCCRFLWIVHSWLPLRFSLAFICPSVVLLFPITIFLCKCRCFSKHPLLYSLILFKNLQFECIPHPVLTWIQKCMWTFHKYWSWGQYTVKPVLRGHIWDKEKCGLIRQVDILKEVKLYEMFYDRTIKRVNF